MWLRKWQTEVALPDRSSGAVGALGVMEGYCGKQQEASSG